MTPRILHIDYHFTPEGDGCFFDISELDLCLEKFKYIQIHENACEEYQPLEEFQRSINLFFKEFQENNQTLEGIILNPNISNVEGDYLCGIQFLENCRRFYEERLSRIPVLFTVDHDYDYFMKKITGTLTEFQGVSNFSNGEGPRINSYLGRSNRKQDHLKIWLDFIHNPKN